MSLSFEERKSRILEGLNKDEKVNVQELAKQLQVSGETIRRDLERLEKGGFLKKVYGGAVRTNQQEWELPFDQKTTIHKQEKRAICKVAANLVQDGDIIMIGNGTTPLEIVPFLADKINVTLITHSVPLMLSAIEIFKGQLIFIGGVFERSQKYTSGPLSERMLDMVKANKAFIAAGGISEANGITDYDISGASISRKLMERADEVIVLGDHSKFGQTTFAHMCSLSEVSRIISDKDCPEEWKHILVQKGIELIIAEEV